MITLSVCLIPWFNFAFKECPVSQKKTNKQTKTKINKKCLILCNAQKAER